ncbi:Kelch repeat-containing protein [Zobellia galactanivorans]|nr:hypothetical protein [Zobellia galactanivorans]
MRFLYYLLLVVACSCIGGKHTDPVWKTYGSIPVRPPESTISLTYDGGNTYWALTSSKGSKGNTLMVLPAGKKVWEKETLSHAPSGLWHTVLADEHGMLWLASNKSLLYCDLRDLSQGWTEFTGLAEGDIMDLAIGSNGSALLGLNSGNLIEVDLEKTTKDGTSSYLPSLKVHRIPKGLKSLSLDDRGDVICVTTEGSLSVDLGGAWMENWEMVARMPGSNHDLRGDVLDHRFYMAGGLTAEYGYPMDSYAYSKLFAFDPETNNWEVIADLGVPRVYCATGTLNGQLWVAGGDLLPEKGERHTTRMVQKVDPKSGTVKTAPSLNNNLSAPLAFNSRGRLYVMGYTNWLGDAQAPLYVTSIGEGETQWRTEPTGPEGKGAIYGCKYKDQICIVVANTYLALFDPITNQWTTIDMPLKVRSPQVASINDEIWVMGGRDTNNQAGVQIYNLKNKQWKMGPDLPRELAWGVGFNLNGQLYVTGGAAGKSYNNRTFRLKNK